MTLKLSMYLRNMGPVSDRDTLVSCAKSAEDNGVDTLWLADHIAIPPDDAEGSRGRYLDPLATIAYLAGVTKSIRLGPGVLVLPYRPALPTAKWIATIQELSQGRFRLGVGVGWMAAEFRAVGAALSDRGRSSDATLAFLNQAFAEDEIESNGQPLLFLPRPPRPEIVVGGAAPHALRRAAAYGDGWMPMTGSPSQLAPQVVELKRLFGERGKDVPQVVCITSLPLEDSGKARNQIAEFEGVGVTEIVHAWRYDSSQAFRIAAESLGKLGL